MFKTTQEFQRLKSLKYGLLRRNWSKYSAETNNKYLQKKAKEFDVKVPKNIKAFEKYAKRIANKIEERQYLYTPENQEVIDQLNNIKSQLSDTVKYNKYSKKNMKINPLSNIVSFINKRFNKVKGNITIQDVIKAQDTFKLRPDKHKPQDIINKDIKEVLEMFDLDNYKTVLNNIGIRGNNYNKLKNEFKKADIYQVANIEPFLRRLEAREEYYLPDSDYYDGDEVDGIRSKFMSTFNQYITKVNQDKEER